MPRNHLDRKRYKLKDFQKWVKMQMAATGKTQAEVGKVLGISQGMVSQMLKDPDKRKKGEEVNPDPFSYGQVLTLCEYFEANGKEKEWLLTM